MSDNIETFTGVVERITFYNDENGYSVIKVIPDRKMPFRAARDGTVTIVGVMPELGDGESVEFTGEWIEDARYGMQMRVATVTPIMPDSLEGIRRYLSSGIVKGIGKKTAEKIVDHFGLKTLEILNREPHRLEEVPSLKTALAEKLARAWAENYAVRSTMIFLQGYGVTAKTATKIHAVYGAETINQVKDDPFALADDIFGIGFKKADQIARAMGLPMDSKERIRAGLSFALRKLSNDGHVYAPQSLLMETTESLLEIDNRDLIEEMIGEQLLKGDLKTDIMPGPDGTRASGIYLPMYYYAETGSADRLKAMIDMPSRITEIAKDIKWTEFLKEIADNNDVELTKQQQSAVKEALTGKLSVLTGGPGTGKTTTLQMVIAALDALDFEFALASPTGRAAKRLSEATSHDAYTIHRLLGFSPAGGFEFNEDSPLDVDMLIVDEASMIDLILFYNMLKALRPETHLMLVGDIDQLPSVGAGNILRDVIESDIAYVTRLETIFRQEAGSHIVLNAHRINEGEIPFTDNSSDDFYFFGEDDAIRAGELTVDVVVNRLPSKFGFDPMEDIQVLAPMYRGPAGVNALNDNLQAQLNGDGRMAEKKISGRNFRVGDKVMQTRNNYDKDIFNGDIGILYGIDFDDNTFEIVFDGRFVYYDWADADELMHAYCISIHRSQGSEYPVVVIPVLTQHYMMLQRNLIYTAITRARKMVVLVGSRKALYMAVNNNQVAQRFSGLVTRLSGG